MKLRVNGDAIQLPDHVGFVSELLKHFSIHDKVVIVEVNGDILAKSEHENTRLSEGDQIEIVHFVGGG